MPNVNRTTATLMALALAGPSALIAETHEEFRTPHHAGDRDIRHVLLLSIDGLHEADLDKIHQILPGSTLDELMAHGVQYGQSECSKPSDSQPGLMALVTGGSPKSTGCFYDSSYDRTLFAPGATVPGVNTVYDETIEYNDTLLDGGGGIDPGKLPLTAPLAMGGVPVYPHSFVRVNTIFEVIKAHGGRTAWCDKSWGYELVNGPSGTGVDDLYLPEIKSGPDYTTTIPLCEYYDDLKVTAVINQINGLDHAGNVPAGGLRVPAVMGMNFQAVSVGQKVIVGGYQHAPGNPMTDNLVGAFSHTDSSIGRMVAALKAARLYDSTLIVISAKHGQAPLDPSKLAKIGDRISPVVGTRAAHITEDDVALIWLTPAAQPDTEQVVHDLMIPANWNAAHIKRLIWGAEIAGLYGDPKTNSRTPDIIVVPEEGVIYTTSGKKNMEHGGFNEDDVHVGLVVANPHLIPGFVHAPVLTTQIAPTILWSLGIDPANLEAVIKEGTPILPGLHFRDRDDRFYGPLGDG